MKYQIRARRLTVAVISALLLIGCDSQNISAADPQKDSPAKSLFGTQTFQPEIVESGGTTYFLTKDGELYERDSDVFLRSNFLERTATKYKDLKDTAPYFPLNVNVRLEYVNGAIRGTATSRVEFIDPHELEFYSDLNRTLIDVDTDRCRQPVFLEWSESISSLDIRDKFSIAPLAYAEVESGCKGVANFEEVYNRLYSRWEEIKEYDQYLSTVALNFFTPSENGYGTALNLAFKTEGGYSILNEPIDQFDTSFASKTGVRYGGVTRFEIKAPISTFLSIKSLTVSVTGFRQELSQELADVKPKTDALTITWENEWSKKTGTSVTCFDGNADEVKIPDSGVRLPNWFVRQQINLSQPKDSGLDSLNNSEELVNQFCENLKTAVLAVRAGDPMAYQAIPYAK